MGSVGLNSARLGAFQSDLYPRGLDLRRSVILEDLGVFKASTSATFEAGMLVALDANQEIIPCVSKSVLGVVKWNKATAITAQVVDEPISWAAINTTVNLKHPSITNLQVRSATDFGGSAYALTTDYTISAANGTVTQVSTGAIPLSTTVYASYQFTLLSSDLDFQGRNFWNSLDEVTIQDRACTVITKATMLFTSMYDAGRVYTLTGAGKNLYCGGNTAAKAGLFTNDNTEGEFVGHVIQVPTADDPFLGVRLLGNPVAYA